METSRIYLSSKRGCTENLGFRSLHTFNFGHYHHEHREPFLALQALNDETLAASGTIEHRAATALHVLLPLVGGANIRDGSSLTEFVEAGEIFLFTTQAAGALTINNPFHDPVNYLYARVLSDPRPFSQKTTIDFTRTKNTLACVASSALARIHIGQFDGRTDVAFTTTAGFNGLFAFVIHGAFEFDSKLVENRDGLSIIGKTSVAFEALSQDAILLLFELT